MSDTDDTDVLLLIPPNFFLVESTGSEDSFLESSRTVVHKPVSCTARVLGKLANQVQTLETRLDSLEITSDISVFGTISTRNKTWNSTDSIDDRSLDRKCFTFPRRRRKVAKRDKKLDLSLTSFDSTSTREEGILWLKLDEELTAYTKPIESIDSPTMDGDISSIVSTPSKKNDKLLLHEIDEFLTKVESYESPESKNKIQETTLSPVNVIKATVDYITHKLDSNNDDEIKLPSGRIVSSSVLDKYIYLVKNNPPPQSDKSLTATGYKNNENTNDIQPTDTTLKPTKIISKPQESKSPSIRRLNFEKDVQPTSTPKRTQTNYLDTFKPSSNKIYDRASKVLEQYKAQNYSHTQNSAQNIADSYMNLPKKEEFKMPQMRPFSENREGIQTEVLQNKLMETIDTDLLSLSELWGERERGDRVDCVKLEEERLKREHCEAMIQQLQKKILDQQEKLAVAIKVDRAKDAAISKLREAWLRLTNSLDKAEERHRNALEKMVREVENFRMAGDSAQKKTNHFESELYKALDLAHDYQEKCKQLTAEMKEMQDNTEKALASKNDVITSKEKDIEVLRENYETVMQLNKQFTDCVKNLEDALEKERATHEISKSRTNELSRKIQSLNDESTLIVQERDLLKEKVNEERARGHMLERQLCDKQNQCSELLKKCDFLDNEVKTLRKHLELQKNELKCHYQKQLEDAVLGKLQEFQQQLDLAEREMEHDARSREQAVVDSCNKQIARIQDQHKLEINVLEEKQREEIKLCRLQLAQAGEKIGLLENKVESYRRRRGQLAGQLHAVMESQWRQALRILTSGAPAAPTAPTAPTTPATPATHSLLDNTHPDTVSTPVAQDYAPPKIPPLTMPSLADKGLQLRLDERRHSADKMFNFEGLSDNELQQYVKLLLTKPPNMDGSGDSPGALAEPYREPSEEPTSDRPDRKEKTSKRILNSSKPPWKA